MSSDRAAVAREVLTDMADWFRDEEKDETAARVVESYRDVVLPAPPAPETVTVGGVEWTKQADPDGILWVASIGGAPNVADAYDFLARIASDARVLAEREARIAELEKEVAHQTDMANQADVACSVAVRERGAALRALEEKGDGHGAKEHVSGNAGDAGSSPAAPIPLGATVEVEGDRIAPFTRRAGYWADSLGNTWADDGGLGCLIAALYHARHPVASRAMVERVARALFGQMWWDDLDPSKRAMYLSDSRAALRAAGFTVEDAS